MNIDRLQGIFRSVFDDEALVIRPDTTAKDVEGWESFNHINLIVALEEDFDVTFTTDEISCMANVGSLVTILQARGFDISF